MLSIQRRVKEETLTLYPPIPPTHTVTLARCITRVMTTKLILPAERGITPATVGCVDLLDLTWRTVGLGAANKAPTSFSRPTNQPPLFSPSPSPPLLLPFPFTPFATSSSLFLPYFLLPSCGRAFTGNR